MYCTRLKTPFSLQLKKQGNKKYIVSVRNVDTIFVTLVLGCACACVGVVLTLTDTDSGHVSIWFGSIVSHNKNCVSSLHALCMRYILIIHSLCNM